MYNKSTEYCDVCDATTKQQCGCIEENDMEWSLQFERNEAGWSFDDKLSMYANEY